jgi:hypothetical protein
MHLAGVQAIMPNEHELLTWDGRTLDYELLLVAIGARATRSLPGSVTIKGPGYTGRFRTMLDDLEQRRIRRVAFAVPSGATWPLTAITWRATIGRDRDGGAGFVPVGSDS